MSSDCWANKFSVLDTSDNSPIVMNLSCSICYSITLGLLAVRGSGAETDPPVESVPAGDSISKLRDKLKSDLTFTRRLAVEELGNMGPRAKAAAPEMIALLSSDSDSMSRVRAAWALGQIGEPRDLVAPGLIAGFRDADPAVVTNVSLALVHCGEDVLPFLASAMKSDDAATRLGAAEVYLQLRKDSPEDVLPVLVGLMAHPEAAVRYRCVSGIGAVGRSASSLIPQLVAALQDQNAEVRVAALTALGKMKLEEDAIRSVAQVLRNDKSKQVRYAAAETLGAAGLGSDEALESLIEAFEDKDKHTRARVTDSVARFGSPALPKVIAAAKNSSPHNIGRIAALDTLTIMGPTAAPLMDEIATYLLEDKDWIVRNCAAIALGAIGSASETVVLALKQAAHQDPRQEVRTIAEHALRQIETARLKEPGDGG